MKINKMFLGLILLFFFLAGNSGQSFGADIYFMPKDSKRVLTIQHEMISHAKKTIDVLAFGFTVGNPMISDLVDACKRGAVVRVYRDRGQSKQALSTQANEMISAFPNCKVKFKKVTNPIMHSKAVIVDGKKVLWGSYNFSKSGPTQDNIEESNTLGPLFEKNFNQLWSTGVDVLNEKPKSLNELAQLSADKTDEYFIEMCKTGQHDYCAWFKKGVDK